MYGWIARARSKGGDPDPLPETSTKGRLSMFGRCKRHVVVTLGMLSGLDMDAGLLVQPVVTRAQSGGDGELTKQEVRIIVNQAVATAGVTNSPLRSLPGIPRTTKMQIAVVSREGKVLALFTMPDAWV